MTTHHIARFMRFVSPEPNSGCWLWTGALNMHGYGIFWGGNLFSSRRGSERAHRWIMQVTHGRLDDTQVIDHKCRVRCCVNPDHMEIVTPEENTKRAAPFGVFGSFNRGKTHCKRGHLLSGETVYIRPGGQRVCGVCRLDLQRVRIKTAALAHIATLTAKDNADDR